MPKIASDMAHAEDGEAQSPHDDHHHDDSDPLSSSRGVVNGIILSLMFYGAVFAIRLAWSFGVNAIM